LNDEIAEVNLVDSVLQIKRGKFIFLINHMNEVKLLLIIL